MQDLLAAICVAFVIEGILYALFPEAMRRFISQVLGLPEGQVRAMGLVAAVIGVLGLWVVRG
ncbi:MAG: DUF2065 domain-containing protein [Bauldia litoralis]